MTANNIHFDLPNRNFYKDEAVITLDCVGLLIADLTYDGLNKNI